MRGSDEIQVNFSRVYRLITKISLKSDNYFFTNTFKKEAGRLLFFYIKYLESQTAKTALVFEIKNILNLTEIGHTVLGGDHDLLFLQKNLLLLELSLLTLESKRQVKIKYHQRNIKPVEKMEENKVAVEELAKEGGVISQSENLSETEAEIISLVEKGDKFQLEEIASSVSISRRSAQRYLALLIEKGLLGLLRKDRKVFYHINLSGKPKSGN